MATKRAIEEERIKIRSELKQIKVKDTIKLADGTVKTHEVTQIEKNDIKTDDTSRKEFDEQTTHTLVNTTAKPTANDWAFF